MKKSDHAIVRIVDRIDAFFDFLSKIFCVISAILIVGLILLIFAGVINRTFIGHVWLFVEELATLALIPISYSVFGYVLRQGRHLKMDLIARKFSVKGQIALSIFSGVFTLVVAVFMIEGGLSWLAYQYEKSVVSTGALQAPLWIFSVFIVVGVAFFAIDLLLFLVNRVFQLVYGEAPLRFEEKIGVEDSSGQPVID